MGIEIRTLQMTDLDEVMEIEPVAFGSHHWSHQSFINELSNSMGNYFAAADDETNQLLGYSGFWLIGEEAHITTLAVHPDHRRQHIGERLLLHDIVQAKKVGANWITLEVRLSNDTAQRLYYKYGFKNLGVRRNYYQDNDEDALVLWTENISAPDFVDLVSARLAALEPSGEAFSLKAAIILPEVTSNGKNGEGAKPEPVRRGDQKRAVRQRD